jgi:hypothetical protein
VVPLSIRLWSTDVHLVFGIRFFLALTLQRFDDSMLPAAGRKNVK